MPTVQSQAIKLLATFDAVTARSGHGQAFLLQLGAAHTSGIATCACTCNNVWHIGA